MWAESQSLWAEQRGRRGTHTLVTSSYTVLSLDIIIIITIIIITYNFISYLIIVIKGIIIKTSGWGYSSK